MVTTSVCTVRVSALCSLWWRHTADELRRPV